MEVVQNLASLLVICENGYGKRTSFEAFRAQGRGGKGVIAIKTSQRNGPVVAVLSVREGTDIIIMTADAKMMRTPVSQIRSIGRNTQGVRIISLSEGDRVVDVARSVAEKDSAELEESNGEEIEPAPEAE